MMKSLGGPTSGLHVRLPQSNAWVQS